MTAASRELPRQRSGEPSLGKQRLRLWLRLLRASRAIEAELRERLRVSFAITLPQFDVVAALARAEAGMTMGELSRMLMVSNGNVTGIVDRLVADGIVERGATPGDRRAIRVQLTAVGRERFLAMARAHEGWVDHLLAGLGPAEVDMMIERLDGLARRVREGAGAS